MDQHDPAALFAQPHQAEEPAPLIADPAASHGLPEHTVEQIRAVDRAFVAGEDQDAIAGLMGLWLSAPWLVDVLADHFRTPPDEEEDVPGPQHRCC